MTMSRFDRATQRREEPAWSLAGASFTLQDLCQVPGVSRRCPCEPLPALRGVRGSTGARICNRRRRTTMFRGVNGGGSFAADDVGKPSGKWATFDKCKRKVVSVGREVVHWGFVPLIIVLGCRLGSEKVGASSHCWPPLV